jgi:lysophospholipase L1-like esterase
MPTILCYGDSNTHGTVPLTVLGHSRATRKGTPWPDVLAARLGPGIRRDFRGFAGAHHGSRRHGGGWQTLGVEVLPAILPSHAPVDLMLLMLGTNDLKPRFSVTAAEIARSLERWSSRRETSCPSSTSC